MFRRLAAAVCMSMLLSSVMPFAVYAEEFSDVYDEDFTEDEEAFFEEDEDVSFDDDFSEEFLNESESEVIEEAASESDTEVESEEGFEDESEEMLESEAEVNEELEAEALAYEWTATIKDPSIGIYYEELKDVKGGTYRFQSFSSYDTYIVVKDEDTGEIKENDNGEDGLNFNLSMTLQEGHDYLVMVYFLDSDIVGSFPVRVYRKMPYTITYNANGGTDAPAIQEVTKRNTNVRISSKKPVKYVTLTYDANGGKVDPADKKVSLPFSSWNVFKGGTGTSYYPGGYVFFSGNMTLYAQYNKSASAGALETPTRPGYIFDGWYTAKTGGTKITSGSMISTSQTIYAHWTKDTTDYGNTVEGFVYRLYRNILNRDAEKSGMDYWVNELKSGRKNGVQAADGFIHSTEFKNRNLSDIAYIEVLYNTFLNRASDASGMNYWLEKLNKGLSRDYVYAGFVNSKEFQAICQKYGIKSGKVTLTEARDQNQGVTMFIYRCYDKFLGRKADAAGLNYWCEQLLNGRKNAKEVAQGFVLSNELTSKNLSDDAYLKIMYQGLFNRAADNAGLEYWGNKLWAGLDRKFVFYGFADSKEFRSLVASFGLSNGWTASKCDKVYDGGVYTIIIPAAWEGKYVTVKNGDWTYFCEKKNNEFGRKTWGDTTMGMLFTVATHADPNPDFPNCNDKGMHDGRYWFLLFPTDVEYNIDDGSYMKSYNDLSKDARAVSSTFQFKRK